MVELKYVPLPDSCLTCKNFHRSCMKHGWSQGQIISIIYGKNPTNIAEGISNAICDNGFERDELTYGRVN